MGIVHVIGAGLAGLSAAVSLVQAGKTVALYEGARMAGGRCRSYYDAQLGQTIDNGNHLVLSGNTSVARYCAAIGADGWHTMDTAAFPFMDVETGERWTIDINEGRLPLWVFQSGRRAAQTRWTDYLPALKIFIARADQHVSDVLDRDSPAYARFWEPLILAVLNTPLEGAAASLLKPVFQETILKGGSFCKPMIARETLADALIEPALAFLQQHGACVHFGQRLTGIEQDDTSVQSMAFGEEQLDVAPGDSIILAIPSWQATGLLPWLEAPAAGEPILNIHYAFDTGHSSPGFIGLVSSLAQWVFVRPHGASVTVSAAGKAMADKPDALAAQCWAELSRAYGWPNQDIPPFRVIKEKRATFDQSPAGAKNRPPARSRLHNLAFAGDWTDTGLPATIEGAIRSGEKAAALILHQS